jgi:type I restriction enzyme S subunit
MKPTPVPLTKACLRITDGTHHSPPIVAKGIPYITAKHVKADGIRFFDDPWFVSEEDHDEIYSRCDPKPGDVLYIKDGATTGIAAVNNYDFPFSMLSSVALLRPDPKACDGRYLAAWLNSPKARAEHLGSMGGAAIKRLTLAKIKAFQIPLPSLPEQKRIAAILDAADALRAKRRESIEQLDSLIQATFLEMFGAPVTNPKGWKTVPLGDHTLKVGSGSTPTGGDAAYKQEGIALIRSQNVHDGEFRLEGLAHIDDVQAAKLANVEVQADDVLLNITGASVARVCRAPGHVLPARVNQHVCIIRAASTLDPIFVEQYLLAPSMKRRLLGIGEAGATRQAITKAQILRLDVFFAPMALQQRFASIVESIEQQKARLKAHLAELDTLFASLQSRAFNGELVA